MSFTLQTKDVLSTVLDVLQSCSLSMEHMQGLKASSARRSRTSAGPEVPAGATPFYRPIKWDKSYYSFTGFRDPEEELQHAKTVEPSLRYALRY